MEKSYQDRSIAPPIGKRVSIPDITEDFPTLPTMTWIPLCGTHIPTKPTTDFSNMRIKLLKTRCPLFKFKSIKNCPVLKFK